VRDVGTLENGAPYMGMEYLEGGDLAAWLEQRGPLPVEQAVEFVLQACEALAEAHSLGIVHRDLKPANLFVIRRADGLLSVKVLDFGISKVNQIGSGSGSDMSMTKTTAVMGSPYYMSPEQMESAKSVDARTDIWAMGVVLHELVSGNPPFRGEALTELILKIVSAPPEPLKEVRPDAPEGLQAVVSRCLEKDRNRRYENVAALAVALFPFGPKRGRESVDRITRVIQNSGLFPNAVGIPAAPSDPPPRPAGARTAASWGQTNSGQDADRRIAFGGLALVVTIGIALGTYWLKSTGHSDAASSSAASPNAQTAPAVAAQVVPDPSAVSLAGALPSTVAVAPAPPAASAVSPLPGTTAPSTAARGIPAPGTPSRPGPSKPAGPKTSRGTVAATPRGPVVAPILPAAPAAPVAPPPPPVKSRSMFDDRK
jgi:serine/threonine protein kinase